MLYCLACYVFSFGLFRLKTKSEPNLIHNAFKFLSDVNFTSLMVNELVKHDNTRPITLFPKLGYIIFFFFQKLL